MDPLLFGHRLRHARRRAGLTLAELGRAVGRQPSYLSQLENGHREPRLTTVARLAEVLGCPAADLLEGSAPTRRAELEMTLARIQEEPAYRGLGLRRLRPSARLDDAALEHVTALYARVRQLSEGAPGGASGETASAGLGARAANAAMRAEMRRRDNHFETIEEVATRALEAAGYAGAGAISEHTLTAVAGHFGFTVSRVLDLPASTRSISDLRQRVMYVPQRNRTSGARGARSVIAQTLGHFALGHGRPADFQQYVRQRVEANYFAGALLAPEAPALRLLGDARSRHDISVEDLGEVFYVSYEMAAHRLTNLITRHLGIPVHFERSDADGVLWKAYENDGIPLPSDPDGTIEGQRLCRWWSPRQAALSEDAYALHCQYTETSAGTFWCATRILVDRERGDAITIGTQEAHARWFRGSETARRTISRCPDPSCCREPDATAARRWAGWAWPSAGDHSQFLSGLPSDTVVFSPTPGVDLTDVCTFLDRHSAPRR